MKSRLSFLSLPLSILSAAAIFCCSCTPANTNEAGEPENEQPAETPTNIYKFVASPLMGVWKADDQIYVHGNAGSEAQVITLTSANLSSDGKTATAELGEEVLRSPAEPDGFYAAWPAQAVNPYKGITKNRSSFKESDCLISVAYLSGDTFTFVDVSSALSFSVSGDYDQYAICESSFDGLNYTNVTVEYSSDIQPKFTKKNNGDPFRKGTIETGKHVKVWMPGDITFKNGITIFVGKNGEWPLACTISDKISLAVGETRDLGDITASLKPFTDPGPKGLGIGDRIKYKVPFNELSGLCVSADGNFLWSVGDNGELAQFDFEGHLLNSVRLKWGAPSPAENGGYDTEGITVNPETGDLLVSMEPNYVGVITNDKLATIFDADIAWNPITTLFRIADAADLENSGTEGITYYKDGQIYVGAQGWSSRKASLYRYDLNGNKELQIARLNQRFPSMSEIAGLCYDPLTDWLWVIDSNSPQKFFVLSGDASRILAVYLLSDTGNPESICVDHKNKCVWVGDDDEDYSKIYKYPFPTIDEYNIE